MSDEVINALFDYSADIRYVAIGRAQEVVLRERSGLTDASTGLSDRFEELLVNPTLVTLARQRGEIDCGGLRYLLVGYGNFHQLVLPLAEGHLSIAFDRDSDPLSHLENVLGLVSGLVGGST